MVNRVIEEVIKRNNPNVLKVKEDKEANAIIVLFKDRTEVVYLQNGDTLTVVEFSPVKTKKLIAEDLVTNLVLKEVRSNYASIITNGRDTVLSPTILTLLNKGIQRVIVESDNNSQRYKTQNGEIIIEMNMKKYTNVTIERQKYDFDVVKYEVDYNTNTLKEQIIRVRKI